MAVLEIIISVNDDNDGRPLNLTKMTPMMALKVTCFYIWFCNLEKGTNVLGKRGNSWLPPDECLQRSYWKPYIFEKKSISPFQKYIVFHGYFEGTHGAVTWNSLNFSRFPCTLVPFSAIWNHINAIFVSFRHLDGLNHKNWHLKVTLYIARLLTRPRAHFSVRSPVAVHRG